MARHPLLLLCLLLSACGGASGAATTQPPGDDPAPYALVSPPARDPELLVFEPFNYDNTAYPNGLSGQEAGFGFAHPWNDADGDVQDRVIGGSALTDASDLAAPSTGGRSIQWGATGTSIFRDLDRTYGTDGTTIWVSYRWISTGTGASESLQAVDFNDATGGFGCVVGQIGSLAGDSPTDGAYDLGDHASRVSDDIAMRDQAVHFVLLRFTYGVADVDSVDCWWDPTSATFNASAPDVSIVASDLSFSRITLRSSAADSIDEIMIGTTMGAVTRTPERMAVYQVGNSLTSDSVPEGIEALAGQAGYLHDEGFHINCGNTLENIYASPATVCVPPVAEYGTWDVALSGHAWDAVAFQPFYGGTSTLGSDETAILDMIAHTQTNPANTDTRYYVYGTWPMRPGFAATWTSSVVDDDATPTVLAREYLNHLMRRLRAATESPIYLIPVGEVLFELDRRLQAGDVPGVANIDQLYRDDFHLRLDLGRFVAGLTVFATLYAKDPAGITKPERYYGSSFAPFTAALYDAVYQSINAVVPGHAYTGVAARP